MNWIKPLSRKGNVCCFIYKYVSMFVHMYTHRHTHIQVDYLFILQVTGTMTYQLVYKGYVIFQWHFVCERLYRLIYIDF